MADVGRFAEQSERNLMIGRCKPQDFRRNSEHRHFSGYITKTRDKRVTEID